VVAALAVGAAASILVSAPKAPTSSSGPVQLVYLPAWLITIASIGLIAFVVGSLVLIRFSGGPTLSMNRMAVTVLTVILLGLVFLAVVHYLGLAGSAAGGNNTTGQNQSVTPPPPPNGGHNFTGSGGVITWPGFPSWLPFVVLVGIALLFVVVAVPELRRYLAERREGKEPPPSPAEVAAVREALNRAVTELGHGADAREVILALYAAMLARLQPMVGGMDTNTPEEIRAAHLERLGARPEPARTLTRLFEEARYSAHPMGPESSRAAQEAVRAVLHDLDRRDSPS
jgi:hypothetical protein